MKVLPWQKLPWPQNYIQESMACHVLVLNTSAWKWYIVLAFMFYGPSKPQGKIWLEIASKSILPYVWNESTQHLWMAIMTNRAYTLSYKYSSPYPFHMQYTVHWLPLGGRKPQNTKWYVVQCFEIICINTNMIFLGLIIRKKKGKKENICS